MGERRKHANLVQKNRILDLLDQRLERLGNKLVRYIGEHSDESIAAQVSAELPPPISKANVRNLRRSHFGELRHVTPPDKPDKPDPPTDALATSAEIKALSAKLDRAEANHMQALREIRDRLTQLTKTDIDLHERLRRLERNRGEQLRLSTN